MDFIKNKELYLKNKSDDRSKKGSLDRHISELVETINRSDDYYTTSSCSGRIMLFKEGESKNDSEWTWVTHDIADPKILFDNISIETDLTFRMEGAILHVCAKSLDHAQKLIDLAKESGFKRSGIIASKKRFMTELISTENINSPLIIDGKGHFNQEYVTALTKKANEKLKLTWKKIEKLHRFLNSE